MIFQQGLASHRCGTLHKFRHTSTSRDSPFWQLLFFRLARLLGKMDTQQQLSTQMVLSLEQELLTLLSKFGMWRRRLVLQLFSRICIRLSCISGLEIYFLMNIYLSVVKCCKVWWAYWTSHCYVLLWKWLFPGGKYVSIKQCAQCWISLLFWYLHRPLTDCRSWWCQALGSSETEKF